jgi:protein AFG1
MLRSYFHLGIFVLKHFCVVVTPMTFTRTAFNAQASSLPSSFWTPGLTSLISIQAQVNSSFNACRAGTQQSTDYRRIPRALSHAYYDPLSEENEREINKIFHALTSENPDDPPVKNRKLETWGRYIVIPESSSTVAKFKFDGLCGQPLSAADYIEITQNFGTIIVTDIPKMDMNQKDLVRQRSVVANLFEAANVKSAGEEIYHIHWWCVNNADDASNESNLIILAACYESKTRLFVTSEVPVFKIFSDDASAHAHQISDHMRSVMDDLVSG